MRHNNFDFLRFYFAFIVVIGHLIFLSGVAEFQKYLHYFSTYTSVTGFFIISGFLITGSYLNSKSLKQYFIKRIARLLPAYIFVILFCAIVFSLISEFEFISYITNPKFFKYLVANLTFLNFIEPCLPGVFNENVIICAVNGALWTLKVEVSFYLIIPLLIMWINKTKKKTQFFIIIYILSIFYKHLFEFLGEEYSNNVYLMFSRQLPGFLAYFISGIACFYNINLFKKNKIVLFAIGVIIYFIEKNYGLEFLTPFALSLIIFTVAFSLKIFNNFGKYGDISYGIYIFHFPIIQLAVYFGFFAQHNPFFVTLCIIVVVLSLGFLSWHLIEKPILNKTRQTKKIPENIRVKKPKGNWIH